MSTKSAKPMHPTQTAITNFLKVPKTFRKDEERVKNTFGFTPFDSKQSRKASELAGKFMEVANSNPNDPIDKVLEAAQKQTETDDPELVRWSLMIFIAHHPAARSGQLRIPSLVKRAPQLTVPKKPQIALAPGPIISDQPIPSQSELSGDGDVELFLDWFREDPNLNEHHEHWHIVYPGGGVPDPNNPRVRITKDRHGELFINMHRQMLARHDIERLALGIPLIKPLENYKEPIPQGYNPNDHLVDSNDNSPYATRQSNKKLGNLGKGMTIEDLESYRKSIEQAIESGKISNMEITPTLLGSTIESSHREMEQHYGSLHNTGHVLLAYINDPGRANDAGNDPGVMSSPRVAARDPVFWRWHRHIDDLFNKWQEKLKSNDFSDAPPVNIKNGDIILTFKDKLPISHDATQDKQAADFGEKTFGGNNFGADVSKSEYVTNELQTKMKRRNWTWVEDSGKTDQIEYLFPREYYYFFRVENTSSSQLDATFRVFLVPEELAQSRRHWIELDKFKQTLAPKSHTVVCRDCDMSSIVRQPPQKTEDELDDTTTPPGTVESLNEKYCDCGWPFHLLLPRGRKDGMKFKLLVFISDWSKDKVPTMSRCGSISYCGAERPGDKYPDIRPMGYPFDRPFKNNSYEETFANLHNASIKDITIRWVDDFPEIVTKA
ncbi:9412_t:CDS:2 [Funneliformis geosporum]|uniref:6516_t:CDS:1 n=1 Tax=Funneliformis geosporum TaxID=1117311 RepID=A0A9W4SFL4_9GLOM|nr:9412_t:CDS:2 [Funneliformis geosporum]CAI2167131.1 6516_t:CDS:2 [Funneliformis geosporum]